MEMHTDSLQIALAQKELHQSIGSEKGQEWELLCSKETNDSFTADAWSNFFP